MVLLYGILIGENIPPVSAFPAAANTVKNVLRKLKNEQKVNAIVVCWHEGLEYRGAHEGNPYLPDGFLEGDPERERILRGEERFDADSARGMYAKLRFMPDNEGYVPCLCGRACDSACWHHLKEAGKLDV